MTVRRPRAVLVDRDWLLAEGALAAVRRLRQAQIDVAVLCDGAAAGVEPDLRAVGPVLCCPHHVDEHCLCRRPAPGLLLQAAALLGVAPEECAAIGGPAHLVAAEAIGVRAVSLPTAVAAVAALLDERESEPSQPPASYDTEDRSRLAADEVVPLVLAGARRLPPNMPWSTPELAGTTRMGRTASSTRG